MLICVWAPAQVLEKYSKVISKLEITSDTMKQIRLTLIPDFFTTKWYFKNLYNEINKSNNKIND